MDNEIDGVSSDAFGNTLQVAELGSTTYDVVLDTDPLDEEVVVTISSDDPTAVQVQKSTERGGRDGDIDLHHERLEHGADGDGHRGGRYG